MKLFPHQTQGVRFLAERDRAYLADDMGLGKTVQAIRAALTVGAQRILLIAPASVIPNWEREWEVWGDEGATFKAVSYASRSLPRLNGADWDVVILDEAHYCKNPQAKRTRNALTIAASAPRAWLLSGTPMPNHPGELFTPLQYLWPEILRQLGVRNYNDWLHRFCQFKMVRFSPWGPPTPKVFGAKNLQTLRPLMVDMFLRRRLRDVALDLPPLRIHLHRLPASSGFAEALERAGLDPELLERMIGDLEADPDGSSSRLRRLLGEYKGPIIAEQVARELEDRAYKKVVVLAYHHATLDVMEKVLKPFNPVGFRGSTPQTKRQEAIDLFTNDPSHRVFLAQQTSAGEGINLQAASEIVLAEPDWSPDQNAQAIKRIHRIGQDAPCRARIFAIAGSLDEAIMSVVQRKLEAQQSLGLK